MLAPEICAQVYNLPCSERYQHSHSEECKPLHTLVGALICVPQLLLSPPQVIHLLHNLADDFFDTAEFRFDGLQLLAGLDGGPVLRICADVDVQFNVSGRVDIAAL